MAASSEIQCLPPEIILQIISKLPISSLFQVKYVCKAWHNLAQDSRFLDLILKRSPEESECLVMHSNSLAKNQIFLVDYSELLYCDKETQLMNIQSSFCSSSPEFDVVSSCNGLLCLLCDNSLTNNGVLRIYNPLTGEYKALPNTTSFHDPTQYVVYGFGFNPITNEYKVVKIIYYWPAQEEEDDDYLGLMSFSLRVSEVKVLSLGSSSWRCLGRTSYYLDDWPGQAVVNGRIHWETCQQRDFPHRDIISFHLEDEQFREVPKPDDLLLLKCDHLSILRGCLSVGLCVNYGKLEIWVMKEYGVKESWVKEFNIASYVPKSLLGQEKEEQSCRISCIAKKASFDRVLSELRSGEILMEHHGKSLVLYDPKTQSFKDIQFKGMPTLFDTVAHVANFNQIGTRLGI
ncbi:F-box protein At3g07870-like [Humulus lupulus]|uniref:F-box protein At3g07870-like n=1 Tax=Humulus lupulus TaxID=3486 RepID=UPI002B40D369|nr:F-box protein At3g07870-like [Humulus lupulus]